jgi:hypothetical protein
MHIFNYICIKLYSFIINLSPVMFLKDQNM